MEDNHPSNKHKSISDAQQTRAYAGYYGFLVGLCWVVSFGLTIAGLRSPLLSNLGLLTGFCSLPLAVNLLRGFRDHVSPLPLRRAWHLAWMTFLAAALICTIAQYIYFAYFDKGLLVRSYTEMLQQPELHDLMQQMVQRTLPGRDLDTVVNEVLGTFSATPPSQLALQFLFWNVLLATVLAIPTMLMAYKKNDNNKNRKI